jgi:2-dehydropantoate 2-reductase
MAGAGDGQLQLGKGSESYQQRVAYDSCGAKVGMRSYQKSPGSSEKVADILGTRRVIIGVGGSFGVSIKSPDHVHHNGMEFVHLGDINGRADTEAPGSAQGLAQCRFSVITFDDVHQIIYEDILF